MRKSTNKAISISWQQIIWVLLCKHLEGKQGLKCRFIFESYFIFDIPSLAHFFPSTHLHSPALPPSYSTCTHVLCVYVYVCVHAYVFPFFLFFFFPFFLLESQASVNYCTVLSHSSSPVTSPRQFGANWIISEQLLSPQEQEKVQEIKIKISQPCSTAN